KRRRYIERTGGRPKLIYERGIEARNPGQAGRDLIAMYRLRRRSRELAASVTWLGSYASFRSGADGDRAQVLFELAVDLLGVVLCLQRNACRQEHIRTAEFERHLHLVGSLSVLFDGGPSAPGKAMPVEEALRGIPEPDDPVFVGVEPVSCK